MPQVHASAIIDGDVDLADDVIVGPGAVIDGSLGPVRIGAGTRIIGSAWLYGPLTVGEKNVIYPHALLGFAPQSISYDPNTPGEGLVIGNRNTFREGFTVHRAMTDEGPTRIGDDNFLMAYSHVGHDCQVGNRCIFVNSALLGGHVVVEDRVTIGGHSGVHQFARLGRGAMLAAGTITTLDVPPWFMLTGYNITGSINAVGLRRSGVERQVIDDVRWVHRVLLRSRLSVKSAMAELRTHADNPTVLEYITFLERCKRGICHGRGQASRGTA